MENSELQKAIFEATRAATIKSFYYLRIINSLISAVLIIIAYYSPGWLVIGIVLGYITSTILYYRKYKE